MVKQEGSGRREEGFARGAHAHTRVEAVPGSHANVYPSPAHSRQAEKRKRPHAAGVGEEESTLEHITKKVQRLHASFEGAQEDAEGLPAMAMSFSKGVHPDLSYLHINQVLKELHFDRLKRMDKMLE